jgi:hypothetical protein
VQIHDLDHRLSVNKVGPLIGVILERVCRGRGKGIGLAMERPDHTVDVIVDAPVLCRLTSGIASRPGGVNRCKIV